MKSIAHINENYESVHAVWLPGDGTFGYVQLCEYADRWLSQLATNEVPEPDAVV